MLLRLTTLHNLSILDHHLLTNQGHADPDGNAIVLYGKTIAKCNHSGSTDGKTTTETIYFQFQRQLN